MSLIFLIEKKQIFVMENISYNVHTSFFHAYMCVNSTALLARLLIAKSPCMLYFKNPLTVMN